jgi:alcohol dehydrogenase
VIDARADVRAQAEALGLAAVTPKQARGLAPAPLVAEISATPAGLRRALELNAPEGMCSSAGSLHAVSGIPTASMFGRNATLIVARSHARALIPGVLALIAEGKLAPERVTTVLAPIDDAAAALNEHLRAAAQNDRCRLTTCPSGGRTNGYAPEAAGWRCARSRCRAPARRRYRDAHSQQRRARPRR